VASALWPTAREHLETQALRVLVIAPFPPRLDGRHGGSRALGQLLDHLATRHRVALLVLRSSEDLAVDDALRKRCELVEEFEIPPVGTSVVARLVNKVRLRGALLRGIPGWASQRRAAGFSTRIEELARIWQPDVIQLEYRIMGQFLPALKRSSAIRILVDHDPDGPEGCQPHVLELIERRAWKSFGRAVAKQVDSYVVFTDRDRQVVGEVTGSTPVTRISLAYDRPSVALDPIGKDCRVVCVGSFIHPPNSDAAKWLAREIFPAVRARVSTATLELVGSHAPTEIRALEGEGVTVWPDVPDVWPYLDAAAVVAAPIRLGGGMRVKVLEALCGGKAIVATPLALEGLDLTDGHNVVIAESGEEFVEALVDLLGDPSRRAAIGRAARGWAESNLDLEAEVREYEALYEKTARRRNDRLGRGRAQKGKLFGARIPRNSSFHAGTR
jgi:glycosyltransferase involved in cell wall biosynthesis